MNKGDTVKITVSIGVKSNLTITGMVEGFDNDYSEVRISQGDAITEVFLADIVSMETITQEVKKTKGVASKIGVPSPAR